MRLICVWIALICALNMSAFAQQQQTAQSIKVSSPAPAFSLTTIDGKIFSLENLKGKVIILNFWTIKCPACDYEVPDLNKLADAYKNNEDVVFLAIAHDSKARVEAFLKKKPLKYQVVPAGLQQMLVPYGLPIGNGFFDIAFPTHILINQQGIVETYETGIKGLRAVENNLQRIFADKNNSLSQK